MVALVCPKCRSYLVVADRPAGALVPCQACPERIAVPADAPHDPNMVKVMLKAIHRYGRPNDPSIEETFPLAGHVATNRGMPVG